MRHNMGKVERIIRLLGGIALFIISIAFLNALSVFTGMVSGGSVAGFILAIVGLVSFVTGVFAYCPLNALLHVNSCEACRVGETHKHLPV